MLLYTLYWTSRQLACIHLTTLCYVMLCYVIDRNHSSNDVYWTERMGVSLGVLWAGFSFCLPTF